MNQNEDILKSIFYELLGKNEVNLNDNLKDIGLDSLQMIILVAKIETRFDINISDEYLDIENFKTVGNVLEMINTLT